MKNLTLRPEEDILAKAREIASERTTSVNALVREYLNDLVRQKSVY
jgi:predicted HicB family RNase H-like nuclease